MVGLHDGNMLMRQAAYLSCSLAGMQPVPLCRHRMSPATMDRRLARFFALCTYGSACKMMALTCAALAFMCLDACGLSDLDDDSVIFC